MKEREGDGAAGVRACSNYATNWLCPYPADGDGRLCVRCKAAGRRNGRKSRERARAAARSEPEWMRDHTLLPKKPPGKRVKS